MADIVSPEVRSRMMAGIRGKNTKIEVRIRKALFARGFRYRLHGAKLPGRPDFVLPQYRVAVFIHGCFWHGHDCDLFRLPKSNRPFWSAKILGNRARDLKNMEQLEKLGWRLAVIWECSMRGAGAKGADLIADRLGNWIKQSKRKKTEIRR